MQSMMNVLKNKALLIFLILFCGLALQNRASSETMTTEIIQLQHRTAGEIAPLIKPILPEGGSVSAYQSKLIVKTTPQSLLEIKKLVGQLDTPPRQLIIHVRQGAVSSHKQTGLIGPIPIIRSGTSGLSKTLQHIKVLDGYPAMIQTGKLFPYVTHYFTTQGLIVHRAGTIDVSTGFYVRPRLTGKTVELQLSTQQESLSAPGSGAINSEQTQTTLRAPLGQWVAIGGTSKDSRYKSYFIFFGTKGYQHIDTALFVKVALAD